MDLILRPAILDDADEFRAAHAALWDSDQFEMGLSYDPDESFTAFVKRHDRFARGIDLQAGFVPATFLVAVAAGAIVGRVSIRHELNDFLATEGGHIGYGVLTPHRRRGYASEMLRQAVVIARSLGVAHPLLICDDDNIGSAAVIERCGGELVDRALSSDGTPIRRYEIRGNTAVG